MQADIREVFSKQREYHEREQLNEQKSKLIAARLKDGYSVEECKTAIVGIHNTPHNLGENDRQTKYLGIHIALRSSNIDRFIETGEEIQQQETAKKKARWGRAQKKEQEIRQEETKTPEQREADLLEFRKMRAAIGI